MQTTPRGNANDSCAGVNAHRAARGEAPHAFRVANAAVFAFVVGTACVALAWWLRQRDEMQAKHARAWDTATALTAGLAMQAVSLCLFSAVDAAAVPCAELMLWWVLGTALMASACVVRLARDVSRAWYSRMAATYRADALTAPVAMPTALSSAVRRSFETATSDAASSATAPQAATTHVLSDVLMNDAIVMDAAAAVRTSSSSLSPATSPTTSPSPSPRSSFASSPVCPVAKWSSPRKTMAVLVMLLRGGDVNDNVVGKNTRNEDLAMALLAFAHRRAFVVVLHVTALFMAFTSAGVVYAAVDAFHGRDAFGNRCVGCAMSAELVGVVVVYVAVVGVAMLVLLKRLVDVDRVPSDDGLAVDENGPDDHAVDVEAEANVVDKAVTSRQLRLTAVSVNHDVAMETKRAIAVSLPLCAASVVLMATDPGRVEHRYVFAWEWLWLGGAYAAWVVAVPWQLWRASSCSASSLRACFATMGGGCCSCSGCFVVEIEDNGDTPSPSPSPSPTTNQRKRFRVVLTRPRQQRPSKRLLDFRAALTDENVMSSFMSFAERVHIVEALRFITVVTQWKAMFFDKPVSWRVAKARTIAGLFISTTAVMQVNISSTLRERIEARLSEASSVSVELFDEALDDILTITEQDAWPRFVKWMHANGRGEAVLVDNYAPAAVAAAAAAAAATTTTTTTTTLTTQLPRVASSSGTVMALAVEESAPVSASSPSPPRPALPPGLAAMRAQRDSKRARPGHAAGFSSMSSIEVGDAAVATKPTAFRSFS